ncbi:hypothetical protein METP3_02609 [Methanosarcinales archaeon]|nr:hypothetical protein METP3_02609 [Methanosarcinales archaeon]
MYIQVYPRIKASFFVLLFLLLVVLFILISMNLFGMGFKKLGFPPEYSVYYLFMSLLGSYINIPIKIVRSNVPVISARASDVLKEGVAASSLRMRSIIAVNLGGAIIPVIMSASLISMAMVNLVNVMIAVLIVSILIHTIARPVRGSGIRIHALIPPLLVSAIALIISPQNAPLIAYISGTLGCLIGIDILNLKKIPDLGVPVVSIGGAGTFDAIFLTGIVSILLA